jgi:hypothetical protein
MTGAVWVMYAPYLPLLKRHEIDGWMLVPAPELGEGEVANELATRIAPGLARLYAIENEGMRLGAFVFRAGVGVGGEIDGADVRLMHRALAIAVLDGNPDPPKLGEVGASIEAHSAMTSDNALVYGHRIGAEGWVAAEYGAMIRTRSGGYNVFDDDSMRFRPPTDLHVPSWPRNLDGELATAVHRCIAVDSDEARRLDRTIGWLDLAWRNAEAITLDLRVMAVRSGFEVLFDVDPALEATAEIRSGLSRLLDEPQAPRTAHRWPNLKGKLRDPEDLSELEWWWMRFTFLRNAIAHAVCSPTSSTNTTATRISTSACTVSSRRSRRRSSLRAIPSSGSPRRRRSGRARHRHHRLLRRLVRRGRCARVRLPPRRPSARGNPRLAGLLH